MDNTLKQLLDKLLENSNYCPYCSGEYTHQDNCILKGLWNTNRFQDDDDENCDECDDDR